tara:strand:- start:1101 stop:1559 length:459 start_codon:yes stop_codon:yes gene_type:complete
MNSQNNYFSNNLQKIILFLVALFLIVFIFFFKNIIFESTLLLKSFGNLSMDPEIAFSNGKPTYLEFYAEWCEICKEMAPDIAELKKEFDNEINFVFLNVDNPKWDKYIKNFNVNGIPQINIIDSNSNLLATLTGLQKENILKESMEYLIEKG